MNSLVGGPVRVVIVDDETLFAKALGAWLTANPGLQIEGYAATGNQGWELCLEKQPDLALVDVEMSDGDGLALAELLLKKLPDTKVIIITGRVDPHTAWRAGRLGVHGLVDKTMDLKLLNQVIRLVAGGGRFLSPSFEKIRQEWLTQPEAFQKVLTNRELAVLYRLTEGLSDLQIGQCLGIAAETVASHRKSLRNKLAVHDDRSLIAYGRKWGIFGTGGASSTSCPR